MEESWEKFLVECRKRLLKARQDRLNGMKEVDPSLTQQISGDEGDMAQTLTDQHTALTRREKMVNELKEINEALARLSRGLTVSVKKPKIRLNVQDCWLCRGHG